MKQLTIFFLLISVVFTAKILGKPYVLTQHELNSPPPRVIRVCCTLGSDLSLFGVPFVKVNQLTSLEKIGPHHFLGNLDEGNGIIYTHRGGFIDMAHLRDNADWTAYLYAYIMAYKPGETKDLQLAYEGGTKELSLRLPEGLDSIDKMELASRIAYEMSVWHEIATGYGARSVPLISEKFSSFSIEDIYSNLLGVTLGIKALKSDLPYEEAMTHIIAATLDSLGAVKTEAETYDALEDVRNIWWTRDARLPENKVTIERQSKVFPSVEPLLVPRLADDGMSPVILYVPNNAHNGADLNNMFQINIHLNYKFPKDIKRNITQNDFNFLIPDVLKELKKPDVATEENTKKGAFIRRKKTPPPA